MEALLPYVISGGIAGVVAWVTTSVHFYYLRRDVDNLRWMVHSPKNKDNLVSVVQALRTRLAMLWKKAFHEDLPL